MGQTGPREIVANLAFGVNLALFILQCRVPRNIRQWRKREKVLPRFLIMSQIIHVI